VHRDGNSRERVRGRESPRFRAANPSRCPGTSGIPSYRDDSRPPRYSRRRCMTRVSTGPPVPLFPTRVTARWRPSTGRPATAHATLRERAVEFVTEPHLVHRAPDYELWLAEFRDSEGNVLALMDRKRRAWPRPWLGAPCPEYRSKASPGARDQ